MTSPRKLNSKYFFQIIIIWIGKFNDFSHIPYMNHSHKYAKRFPKFWKPSYLNIESNLTSLFLIVVILVCPSFSSPLLASSLLVFPTIPATLELRFTLAFVPPNNSYTLIFVLCFVQEFPSSYSEFRGNSYWIIMSKEQLKYVFPCSWNRLTVEQARHSQISSGRMHFWGNRTIVVCPHTTSLIDLIFLILLIF